MTDAAEPLVGTVAVLGWLAIIGWVDSRSRRIPNDLLLAMLVLDLTVTAWRGTGVVGSGVVDAGLGAGIAAALFLPSYALKGVGAGDAKLGMMIGLLLGSSRILPALIISGMALGFAALLAYGWGIFRKQPVKKIPAALPISVGVAAKLLWPSLLGAGL